jgi:hypothetical protein
MATRAGSMMSANVQWTRDRLGLKGFAEERFHVHHSNNASLQQRLATAVD